jgi:hypothetical protein
VESKFQSLLEEAKAMQSIFVVGKVPDTRQTVNLTTLMARHFDKFGAKLQPAPVKTGPRRFSVPTDKTEEVKSVLRHYNLAIRDLGWWVAQDVPAEMRRMNSTVYSFFKYARDRERRLRGFRLEADSGYLVMNDHQLLPIYMVPSKKNSWDLLVSLLADVADSFLEHDWLESAISTSSPVPEGFVSSWCKILKLDAPKQQMSESRIDDTDMDMMSSVSSVTPKTTSGGG